MDNSGYMKLNDLKIKVNEKDYAEMIHTITPDSMNLYGLVHGGLYYSLADAAAGIASRSDGNTYVTLNSNFNYLKAVNEGDLIACATVISRTSKICVISVDVKDTNDLVVSHGTFTMYKVRLK